MILSVNLCLAYATEGYTWLSWQPTPETILSHFSYHTGELSSITLGAHEKAASTESIVVEQSTSRVKRKCIRNEYITSPALSLEQESEQG